MYWHLPKLENGPVEVMVFDVVFGSVFVFWSKKRIGAMSVRSTVLWNM
jgi:hypothetical protein